jgi:hypothetical protein
MSDYKIDIKLQEQIQTISDVNELIKVLSVNSLDENLKNLALDRLKILANNDDIETLGELLCVNNTLVSYYAVYTLSILACNPEFICLNSFYVVIRNLLDTSKGRTDIESQRYATFVLAKFSTDGYDALDYLRVNHAIALLEDMLRSEDRDTKRYAIYTLLRMSADERCKKMIIDSVICIGLLTNSLWNLKDIGALQYTVLALKILFDEDSEDIDISSYTAIESLISLLWSELAYVRISVI